MASSIERRFDLARAALSQQAEEQSLAQQEALKSKFASSGGLESGAAIKEAQGAERALRRAELSGQSELGSAEAQAKQQSEQTALQRQFQLKEAEKGREFASEQTGKSREFASSEAQAGREHIGGKEGSDVKGLAEKRRDFESAQAKLANELTQQGIEINKDEFTLNQQITLDNLRRAEIERQRARKEEENKGSFFDKAVSGELGTELITGIFGEKAGKQFDPFTPIGTIEQMSGEKFENRKLTKRQPGVSTQRSLTELPKFWRRRLGI